MRACRFSQSVAAFARAHPRAVQSRSPVMPVNRRDQRKGATVQPNNTDTQQTRRNRRTRRSYPRSRRARRRMRRCCSRSIPRRSSPRCCSSSTPGSRRTSLAELPGGLADAVLQAVAPEIAVQWKRNQLYAQGSIGRLMEPAYAVFRPGDDGRPDRRAAARADQDRVHHLRLRDRTKAAGCAASSPCATCCSPRTTRGSRR